MFGSLPATGRRWAGLFITLLAIAPLAAQAQEPQAASQAAGPPKNENTTRSDSKKGEWVIAPIPIKSPAIGGGLEWAVVRVFPLSKQDEVSPPSLVGAGGVFTNNGTKAMALGGRLYFKEDRFRIATAIGTADVNLDIYGIGKRAGDNGTFIPLNTSGTGFLGEFLYGLKKGVYLGVRSQYRNFRLSLNTDRLESSDITREPPEQVANVIDQIGDQLFHQQTVSMGPRFQLDTRDSTFYPKKGLFIDVYADFFSQTLGSKFTYQYYRVGINKYLSLGEHQVLAFRGMSCAAVGDRVPIYDMCLYGAMNDIRGYSAGRYQDHRMFATQGEYRLMLPVQGFLGRFGVVGFAGFGGVGHTFSDIGWSELLPGGGAGVRFRLTKKHPINFRCDYGIGNTGHTLSIGVLEAF